MKFEATLATVTSIDDPAKGGAVKVVLPEIGGDEYPEWIEPVFPGGCWFCMPEVGDTVLVLIPEGEDVTEFSEQVRYLGRLISESEALPDDFKENYPKRRGFETKKGHQLILDDKTGDWLIKTYKGDHEITLKGAGTVTIKNGKTGDTIEMSAAGTTTSKATVSNVLQAPLTHLKSALSDLNQTPTDFLLKGTTFFSTFVTTFLQAWKTALQLATPPPVDPNWIAYKAAMLTAVNNLITASAGWVSVTTRTS